MSTMTLAGKLDVLGDSLIGTLSGWADGGLKAVLVTVVVVTMARKFSLKAGIGALIALVVALSIYNSRDSLAGIFSDEINHPAKGAGAVTIVVTPSPETGTDIGTGSVL